MSRGHTPEQDWPEAMATVLSCTYSARVGRAVAFGLPSGKHFRITYNYWAGGALHEGEFFSEKAMPQGSLFPIRYDPELPSRNQHGGGPATPTRAALLTVGVVGSVVLSLAWLLVLRGCHP